MANKTAEEILESLLRPNADDETPEGDIRNYRTLVLHDSEFQPRIDEASRQLYEAELERIGPDESDDCCQSSDCGDHMWPAGRNSLKSELRAKARAFYGITESEDGK